MDYSKDFYAPLGASRASNFVQQPVELQNGPNGRVEAKQFS